MKRAVEVVKYKEIRNKRGIKIYDVPKSTLINYIVSNNESNDTAISIIHLAINLF